MSSAYIELSGQVSPGLSSVDRTPLPADYKFANATEIDPHEVVALMRTVVIGEDQEDDYIYNRNAYMECVGLEAIDVGILHDSGSLVGFGSICMKGANGELGDFVVNPKHQGRGLGRAIIDERLRAAEAAELTSLFILPLEATNPLESFYLQRGFQKITTVYTGLGRGPDPQPVY